MGWGKIKMKYWAKSGLLILGVVFLAGCVSPEHNMKLEENFWQTPNHQVVLAEVKCAEPALYKIGDQGLLEVAINTAVTKEFDRYLSKTSLHWYHEELPKRFMQQFKQRNIAAEQHHATIDNKQAKNPLAIVGINGDQILLLDLQKLGAVRSYYGFFPVSTPKAYCVLKGELINRKDKKVLWRHLATIEEVVGGAWDQPPNYPNFTRALKEAINAAQDEVLDSFFSGH